MDLIDFFRLVWYHIIGLTIPSFSGGVFLCCFFIAFFCLLLYNLDRLHYLFKLKKGVRGLFWIEGADEADAFVSASLFLLISYHH